MKHLPALVIVALLLQACLRCRAQSSLENEWHMYRASISGADAHSGALILWDTQSGQELATLSSNEVVSCFAFSPEGSHNGLRTESIVIGKGRSGPRNPERELSAQLIGPIKSVRLYDLDGSGAVEQLAADIKAHWLMHTSPDAP